MQFHRVLRAVSSLAVFAVAALVSAHAARAADAAGYAEKKPVIGAACPSCPWGALADKVKAAMQPLGYDVRVCYNCSGVDSIPIVLERRKPLPLTTIQARQARDLPAPPDAAVDFGVVNLDFIVDAHRGIGRYKGSPPRKNLRLLANIEDPQYYLVATRAEAFITDLKQIKEQRLPVRLFIDDSIRVDLILEFYGLSRAELASFGATITQDRDAFDVIINFANSLNNTPESNIWYQASQKHNLRYLQLPESLLSKLAAASEWEIGDTPVHLLRGMERPVRTIRTSGTVIYGRDDMPAQFAYDVAKAMDVHKDVLVYSILPFAYNPDHVWQARGVPLHPGAERYYRERGYIPRDTRTPQP